MKIEGEVWKSYGSSNYEISSYGRCRSLDRESNNRWGKYTIQGKLLKPIQHGDGYVKYHIVGHSSYYCFAHRMVAETFLPNKQKLPEVDHLDKNRSNNHIDNLEWVSYGDNNRRRFGWNFRIAKTFSFCYGHRVWSQDLDCDFSLTKCNACRHLHGHEGLVRVYLSGDRLHQGMVTDFKHLGWFKDLLDTVLDHKFIIDENDPIFDDIVGECSVSTMSYRGLEFKTIDLTELEGAKLEWKESFVIVDFVPTSENISRWLADAIVETMAELPINVAGVELFETPKSSALVTMTDDWEVYNEDS